MEQLSKLAKRLPNGASMIITGTKEQTNETVFVLVAKKDNKVYIKESPYKEICKLYMDKLFGGKSDFCGKFTN